MINSLLLLSVSRALTDVTTDGILARLVSLLTVDGESGNSLNTIDSISRADRSSVQKLMSRQDGTGEILLSNLLHLEQSSNDIVADRASSLSTRLASAIGDAAPETKYNIVIQNLERVSQSSLTMDGLLDLTRRLLSSGQTIEKLS